MLLSRLLSTYLGRWRHFLEGRRFRVIQRKQTLKQLRRFSSRTERSPRGATGDGRRGDVKAISIGDFSASNLIERVGDS